MGRTFYAEKAEQEANKIGMKFAHSNDVVRDMSRAYHTDFSNIKVHHDAAADSKVKAAGKDALAQGNDLFFGKGIFESSDPASKGLVAHEFAHTMQQGAAGGEGAVAESTPMGAEQGGLRDWFKRYFTHEGRAVGRTVDLFTEQGYFEKNDPADKGSGVDRIIERLTEQGFFGKNDPADKEPVAHEFAHTTQQGAEQGGLRDWFKRRFGAKSKVTNVEAPTNGVYKLRGDKDKSFMSTQSRALYQMVQNATPEQLQDPAMRKLVMEDFQQNMSARLQNYENADYASMYSEVFRGAGSGELFTLNKVLGESFADTLPSLVDVYNQTAAPTGDSKLKSADNMLDYLENDIEMNQNGKMDLLNVVMETLGTSKHFSGENADAASHFAMNNLVLRALGPKMTAIVPELRTQYVNEHSGGKELTPRERGALESEAKEKGVGTDYMHAAASLQKAVNDKKDDKGNKLAQPERDLRFLNFMKRHKRH